MPSSLATGAGLALLALLPLTARAEPGGPPPGAGMSGQPGHGDHEIPGLAADEIAELREGHGLGQARVAEVQGYPGPRHVLEAWSAGQLSLGAEQLARVQEIHRAMASEARRLGALVVDTERDLALAFRSGAIDTASLPARVERIAALRGQLRAVHLRAHLLTRAVLDPEQLARYAELRGHGAAGAPGHAR